MPRDYKHAPRATRKKKAGAPGWAWFFAGLAIGLFAAFMVYVYDRSPAVRAMTASALPPAAAPVPAAPKAAASPRPEKAEQAKAPAARPRFEFYTILPEKEVTVPDQEIAPRRAPPGAAAPASAAAAGASYVLQAGSFRHMEEADRLKARLALIGLEAEIQSVTVNGDDTWHRVRLGPFTDLGNLDAARARLREHQVEAIVLKIKA